MTLDTAAPPTGTESHDTHTPDDSAAVRLLLEMSALTPSEAEVAALTAAFARARAGARSLYAVAEARYEQPAQTFQVVGGGEYGLAR